MFGTIKKWSILLIAVVLLFSVTGVWATWQYATADANTQYATLDTMLHTFEYTIEEILPGVGLDHIGQNHQKVINNIVDDRKYGLNSNHKPIIKNLLQDGAEVVYSQQKVTGGNLKNMLPTSSSTEAVEFAVEFGTDTIYNAYTYAKLSNTSVAEGTLVDVYKTVMVYENGVWKATIAYPGKAPVKVVKVGGDSIRTIDVTKWQNAKGTVNT